MQDSSIILDKVKSSVLFRLLIFSLCFIGSLAAKNTHRSHLTASSNQFFQAADSSSLDLSANMTVEAWVKPTSLGVDRILLGKSNFAGGHSYALSVYADGRLRLDVFQNDTTFRYAMTNPGALQVNVWQHIAATYDHSANTVHIYVNGVDLPFMNGGGVITGIQNTSTPFTIGARLNGSAGTEFFDGSIDEVRVWSVARTQQECRASMLRELTGSEAGLSACWTLNDSLADSSPNVNTLTFRDGSLKAHYRLEDTTDSSVNGNNLTNNGGVAFNAGKFGNGADLGPSNTAKRLHLPDDFSGSLFNGSSSWSLWFNPSSQPVTNGVFELIGIASYSGSLERGYRIQYVDEAGIKKLKWSRYNYGGTGTDLVKQITLDVGTWHHLALVYEASSNTLKGFLDGVEVASKLCSNDPSGGGSAKQISIGSWVTPLFFTSGMIDDVVVLGRALSSVEIGQLQTNEFAATNFIFKSSDLPFSDASLPVEWCADKDTRALFHFNGDAVDISPSGHHGSGTAVIYGDGILDKAATFNGTTSRFLASGFTGQTQATYAFWVRLSAQTPSAYLFNFYKPTNGGNHGLSILPDGNLRFSIYRSSPFVGEDLDTAGLSLSSNQWHAVVATASASEARIYVDGILRASRAITQINVGQDLTIGSNQSDATCISGQIDEFTISQRVWSPEEIMKHFGGISTAMFSPVLDGVLRSDRSSLATWSEIRQGATSASTTDTLAYLCRLLRQSSSVPGWRDLHRGVMHFDSSPLPDGGISINHSTIDIRIPNKGVSAPSSLVVVRSEVVSDTSLANSDFNLYGTTELAPRTSFASIATGAINRIPLNDSGLGNLRSSGVSKFFFLVDRDFDNSEPSEVADRYLDFDTAESTNEKPKLVIEYHALSAASISGTVAGTNLPEGVIRVVATSTTTSTYETVTLSMPGPYSFTGLSPGQSYNVIAFVDSNTNGSHDPLEWFGNYASSPLLLDGPKSGIDILVSVPADSDNDGLPDRWETANGLVVGIDDAGLDKDGDGLTNLQELWLGLGANDSDSDNDGLLDGAEVDQYGSNPLQTDSDGDGFPDKWEADHGLDLNRDDRKEDRDFDFLTNEEEFVAGLNPASSDSDSNGTTDYKQLKGKTDWDALYDRNDRLLGVRHERGASFGYQYDGNSNLVRQVKLGRDSDNDGLSDLWEFSNGLDPKSPLDANGLTGDLDGDGWTNFQEYVANSNPASASDKPGIHGTILPAIPFPFTPTRFVIGTGQLDSAGSEEIVVSADGNPLGGNNFIQLYREGDSGWVHEDIPVGDYGVTSLTIGAVGVRQAAIYAGLRKTGGQGRVIEILRVGTTWQTKVVSDSLAADAWVHGIRTTPFGMDLMLGLYTRYGPDEALYSAVPGATGWSVRLSDVSASDGSAATLRSTSAISAPDQIARRLQAGGTQIATPRMTQEHDGFDGVAIDPLIWTNRTNAQDQTESGGYGRIDSSWGSGGSVSSGMETTLLWPTGSSGLEIRIPLAEHSQPTSSRFGGQATISLGSFVIYASGQNRSDTNVDLQIIRGATQIFTRKRVNGGAWGDWSSGPLANTLRLESAGSDIGSSSSYGTCRLYLDYIRYRQAGELLTTGKSTNDHTNAEAAYNAAANAWFFKTSSALSWRDSHLYAVARGGGLAAIESADMNTWIQGKFSGEQWVGLCRNSSAEAWHWLGSSDPGSTAWGAGQPSVASDQVYAFANVGLLSSATGSELKNSIYEVRQAAPEVTTSNVIDPSATSRLSWAGRGSSGGRFNPSSQTEASLVQTFVDDKDGSGSVSPGDELVVGETVLGASPTDRTLVRRILPSTSGNGFGLASFRTHAGTSDVLATAEPDGQVCVWLPTTAGGPLQRKVLSLDHVGKGWHGLEKFNIAGGVQGLAGLRVDPSTPGSVDLVIWNGNDLGFVTPPVIQQSPPTARLLSSPAEGGATAPLSARIWDSEGNKARLGIRFKNPTSGIWQTATLTRINGVPPTASFNLATGPAGITHALIWNAGQDLGASFQGSVLVKAQATDNSGSGEWSAPLAYTIDGTTDTDGDGMPDTWETSNGLNPSVADASLDKDHDGVDNLMEFALGMNPGSSDPHLLPKLTIEGGYAVLTIDRNAEASNLVFAPQQSTALGSWNSGPDFFTVLEDTPTRLRVRLKLPVSVQGQAYIRLQVSKL